MEDLNARARGLALEMMTVASRIRTAGEEVALMFAFDFGGKDVRLVPAAEIPHSSKEQLTNTVRLIAAGSGAQIVLTAMECWVGMNPMVAPSEDPARMEAILVSASGSGVNITMMRPIEGDGTLGEIIESESAGGTFTNLSGREMMN